MAVLLCVDTAFGVGYAEKCYHNSHFNHSNYRIL